MIRISLHSILFHHREDVEVFRLTDLEYKVLSYIHALQVRGKVSSGEIASVHGISVISANAVLKKLYNKKYLERENVGDPTGGNLYLYKMHRNFYG